MQWPKWLRRSANQPPKLRVFIDSSVLILASKAAEDDVSVRALEELDRDVDFLFSKIVELETLPQPTINKYAHQVSFLNTFFKSAQCIPCDDRAQNLAMQEACSGVGLGAADALHVACAVIGKADELVCAEKAVRTLPKATALSVRTIEY